MRQRQVGQNDRMLSYLPLAHVAERAAVQTSSLFFGFQLFFANSLDTFQEDLQRARPTIFFSVPRLWMKFYLAICDKLPPKKQKILFKIPLLNSLIKRKILKQLGLNHVRAAIPVPRHWLRRLSTGIADSAWSCWKSTACPRTSVTPMPTGRVRRRWVPWAWLILVSSIALPKVMSFR